MGRGLWIAFEGPDGSGKSTTMKAVAAHLRGHYERNGISTKVIETKHPGSTPLGRELRELVKHQDKRLGIDPLSAQMLMYTDHINFKNVILEPALEQGAIVLADRCDLVSGMVYGEATGLEQSHINLLLNIACGMTRIDTLYIMRVPKNIQDARLVARYAEGIGVADRFEATAIRERVNRTYDELMTGSQERMIMINKIVALDNIRYKDSDRPVDEVAYQIAREIIRQHAMQE